MSARKRLAAAVAETLETRRLLANVTAPDLTFGSNGVVNAEAGVYLKTLHTGDVVAIGTIDSQAISKFLPSGAPARSFGTDGVVTFKGEYDTKLAAFTADDIFTYGIIDEDTAQQQLRAVSLSTGQLDKNFGSKGSEAIPIQMLSGDELASSTVSNISAMPDGGLLISENLQLSNDVTQCQLVKLNADGSIDQSFGSSGYLVLPASKTSSAWWTSNGIVVVQAASDGTTSLIRYSSSGAIDKSLGSNGSVGAPAGGALELLEQPNGALLLLQGQNILDQASDLVRFDTGGAIDTSFGTNGVVTLTHDNEFSGQGAMSIDRSGRIDVITDDAALRFTPSGELDTTFGDNGTYSLGDDFEVSPRTIAADTSGNVLFGTDEQVTRLSTGPAASLVNGVLLIRGDSADDVISVSSSGANASVTVNGDDSNYALNQITGVDVGAGDGKNNVAISLNVPCTVLTGLGNDTITTAGGDDSISSSDGDDSITSGAGNDTIDAGRDNNTISSGDGDDSVTAIQGEDTVSLGAGKDQLSLDDTRGDVTGAAGKKVIALSSSGDTTIHLGTGGAFIHSEQDLADTMSIRMAGGNNSIDMDMGQAGDNISIGGAGNNLVTTGDGANTITTGDGNDTINLNGTDSIHAGGGNDLVQIGSDNPSNCTVDGGDGNDTLTPGDGSDLVTGGDGNDFIRTGDGNDSLYGNGGNDTIRAGGGADYISGGGGKDQLFGQFGNDTIYGGDGNDYIQGGPDHDLISGQAGNDKLFAADGDADSVYGGSGTDSAFIDPSLDTVSSIESISPG